MKERGRTGAGGEKVGEVGKESEGEGGMGQVRRMRKAGDTLVIQKMDLLQ